MVVEWILSLAGEALRAGAPVKDREVFTLANGKLRYDAYALPLGEEAGGVDHVLCYVHQDQ